MWSLNRSFCSFLNLTSTSVWWATRAPLISLAVNSCSANLSRISCSLSLDSASSCCFISISFCCSLVWSSKLLPPFKTLLSSHWILSWSLEHSVSVNLTRCCVSSSFLSKRSFSSLTVTVSLSSASRLFSNMAMIYLGSVAPSSPYCCSTGASSCSIWVSASLICSELELLLLEWAVRARLRDFGFSPPPVVPSSAIRLYIDFFWRSWERRRAISSWYSLSIASLGSSLILGLFLILLARLA